jgi:hypothetical protein
VAILDRLVETAEANEIALSSQLTDPGSKERFSTKGPSLEDAA